MKPLTDLRKNNVTVVMENGNEQTNTEENLSPEKNNEEKKAKKEENGDEQHSKHELNENDKQVSCIIFIYF